MENNLFNTLHLSGTYKEVVEDWLLENGTDKEDEIRQVIGVIQLLVELEKLPLVTQVNTLEKEVKRLESTLLGEKAKSNALEEKLTDLEKENFRLRGIIDTLKEIQIYGDKLAPRNGR